MTTILFLLLLAVAVALYFDNKAKKGLSQKVLVLENRITSLTAPKPFGLRALELVGAKLNGLTREVARAALTAAEVCSRPITVAQDLEQAKGLAVVQIAETKLTVEDLQAQIRARLEELGHLQNRQHELEEIGNLLP
jgi:hypothetical protein